MIWDNLCSMHRGGDYDETRYRRDMRRTTVSEGEPPVELDDPFVDLLDDALSRTAAAAV